ALAARGGVRVEDTARTRLIDPRQGEAEVGRGLVEATLLDGREGPLGVRSDNLLGDAVAQPPLLALPESLRRGLRAGHVRVGPGTGQVFTGSPGRRRIDSTVTSPGQAEGGIVSCPGASVQVLQPLGH